MNQRRAKEFRKLFGNDRRQYRHFKKRYTRSSLPLQLEVIATVQKIKSHGPIKHLEVPDGR